VVDGDPDEVYQESISLEKLSGIMAHGTGVKQYEG